MEEINEDSEELKNSSKMYVLKNDKGLYHCNCTKTRWTKDLHKAEIRRQKATVVNDAKKLLQYKKEGRYRHLTNFEKLYVQKVTIVEVGGE